MTLQPQLKSTLQRHSTELMVVVLLAVLYLPLIIHWYDGWLNKTISLEHEYYSHGVIGLPFAAYIVWEKRHKWQELPDQFNPFGAVLLGLAAAFYISGAPDLVSLSFPILLSGLCFGLKGVPGMKLLSVPWLLVLLATPTDIPYLIAPFSYPLQSFIAGTAGFILTQWGFDVTVQEIFIYVGGRIVEVAPHCAGFKMLFTTLYVALMLLYWTGALRFRKTVVAFLFSGVLISVITNILRNTFLTLLHGQGQDELFDWLHEGWGGDMVSALMLLALVPTLIALEKLRDALSGTGTIESV
ncbi:cyanoexosortase B [Geitlerinema sp. P-1104]|uniref:cyanoexosortase B n=1 Tax=Geitlerinema sp. P-1104 TaxID=2546230 RepID=UPI00147690E9|nr:cyanoexosortase B [Geitlerinema sp. P-1104]NMG60008.1 cyanoexosortase B [Geitlerinema sp. P-1104]